MMTEKTAGAMVTTASVRDRKISTSSTMMNRAEYCSTWFPVLPDAFCWSTWTAIAPARCACSPAGSPAREMVARSESTRSGGRVLVAAGLAGQHDQLPGVPVRGAAGVDDLADAGGFPELALQVGHGRHIGRGQRRSGTRDDHRDGHQVGGAEWGREGGGVLARRAVRQELGVVVLGHAGQRWQQRGGGDGPGHPYRQHQPAEADAEGSDGPEDGVNVHVPNNTRPG